MLRTPKCFKCEHYVGIEDGYCLCKAFPEGIPGEIILGEHDHSTPYPNAENRTDNGYVFSPKQAQANG